MRQGKPAKKQSRREEGFSLILVVAALLVFGASVLAGMRYLAPSANLARQSAVNSGISHAVQPALLAYAARNYALPCPARATASNGTADCTVAANGVVPWKTLGLQPGDGTDGWGHLIGYAVSPSLTTGQPYKNSVPTTDAIPVSINGAGASNYAYVLISYGPDGAGAYNPQGGATPAPAAATREYSNTQGSSFVVWPYDDGVATAANLFDDTLAYETSGQICQDLHNPPYCHPSAQSVPPTPCAGGPCTLQDTLSLTSNALNAPSSNPNGVRSNAVYYPDRKSVV